MGSYYNGCGMVQYLETEMLLKQVRYMWRKWPDIDLSKASEYRLVKKVYVLLSGQLWHWNVRRVQRIQTQACEAGSSGTWKRAYMCEWLFLFLGMCISIVYIYLLTYLTVTYCIISIYAYTHQSSIYLFIIHLCIICLPIICYVFIYVSIIYLYHLSISIDHLSLYHLPTR